MALTSSPEGNGREQVWRLPARVALHGNHGHIDLTDVPYDRAVLKQATVEARIALEEAVIAAAVAAQRAFTVAEALDEALAALQTEEMASGAAQMATPSPGNGHLSGMISPREREVLALVAEGRSNKAIAETLFVSPNTIKTHVTSLLSKLHAESRVQLAAMAARGAMR